MNNKIYFLEKKNSEEISASKIELDEVRQVEKLTQSSEPTKPNLIESNSEPFINAPLRISNRISCPLDRYYDFLIWDGNSIELDENNKNLISYMDAM